MYKSTVHDFSHTGDNFLAFLGGKNVVGLQEPNGGNHGGVAVPVAVLVVKKNAKSPLFNLVMGGIRTG